MTKFQVGDIIRAKNGARYNGKETATVVPEPTSYKSFGWTNVVWADWYDYPTQLNEDEVELVKSATDDSNTEWRTVTKKQYKFLKGLFNNSIEKRIQVRVRSEK